jgi:hypothetical protein
VSLVAAGLTGYLLWRSDPTLPCFKPPLTPI